MAYTLSKANTFALIDHDLLKRELLVRKIECELPKCNGQAVGITEAAVPAFVCQSHLEIFWDDNPVFAKVLLQEVTNHLKQLTAEAASAAYDYSHEEILLAYDGKQPLIESAREAVGITLELPAPLAEKPLEQANQIEMPEFFLA